MGCYDERAQDKESQARAGVGVGHAGSFKKRELK